MSQDKEFDRDAPIPSAEELRVQLLEKELEKMDKARKVQEKEKQKLTQFTDNFLKSHVTDAEIAVVRRVVANAVKDGKFEAMVYSFPSTLCTDRGRAINNNDPNWPNTLQGKAKEFYDRYQKIAKPAGYRLKAMIINFPGDVPGDVGFFINWQPQTY